MKIIIDADGCPVVDITCRIAKKEGLDVFIYSDTSHIFSRDDATCITVDKGLDSVDFAIISALEKSDLVITQDYGLASMCLTKGAYALRQDGLCYTESNIDILLNERYIAKNARMQGVRMKGPKKRSAEKDEAFERALTKLLSDIKK